MVDISSVSATATDAISSFSVEKAMAAMADCIETSDGFCAPAVSAAAALVVFPVVVLMMLVLIAPNTIIAFRNAVLRRRAGMVVKTITANDFTYSYLEGGSKSKSDETVLLLHGFSSEAEHWTQFAAFLTPHKHVLALDLPGHGGTTDLPLHSHVMHNMIEHVQTFLESTGTLRDNRRVHVAGLSFGGMLAGCYAAEHPEHVNTLTLICPAGIDSPDRSEMQRIIDETGQAPLLPTTVEEFSSMIDLLMHKRPYIPKRVLKAMFKRRLEKHEYFEDLMSRIRHPDIIFSLHSVLEHIHAPTLVIWGENDKILDASATQVLMDGVEDCALVMLPNIGHTVYNEHPEIGRRVLDFIDERSHYNKVKKTKKAKSPARRSRSPAKKATATRVPKSKAQPQSGSPPSSSSPKRAVSPREMVGLFPSDDTVGSELVPKARQRRRTIITPSVPTPVQTPSRRASVIGIPPSSSAAKVKAQRALSPTPRKGKGKGKATAAAAAIDDVVITPTDSTPKPKRKYTTKAMKEAARVAALAAESADQEDGAGVHRRMSGSMREVIGLLPSDSASSTFDIAFDATRRASRDNSPAASPIANKAKSPTSPLNPSRKRTSSSPSPVKKAGSPRSAVVSPSPPPIKRKRKLYTPTKVNVHGMDHLEDLSLGGDGRKPKGG